MTQLRELRRAYQRFSNPNAEFFNLGNYNVKFFLYRGRFGDLSDYDRTGVANEILKGTQLVTEGNNLTDEQLLALASYPLVDAMDPDISNRCNWLIFSRRNKTMGIFLDYYGEHNQRYFCYASEDAISAFLRDFPKTNYLSRQQKDDFRVVLPTWLFDRQELPYLIDKEWVLRRNPEKLTRLYLPLATAEIPTIEIDKKYQIVDLNETRSSSIMQLLKNNYPQHSFRSAKNHKGVIDTTTDKIVAMSGILGQAIIPEYGPITLVGNLVTDSQHRGKNLAKAVRVATLQQIKTMENFNQGIVVADVNQLSLGVNEFLGFHKIPIDSSNGSFWWCIYDRVV